MGFFCSSRVTNSFQTGQACVCHVWRTFLGCVFFAGRNLSRVTNFSWVCFFCLSRVTNSFQTSQACVRHVWRTFLEGGFLFVTCDELVYYLSGLCSSHVTNSFLVWVRFFWRRCFFCSSHATNLFATCQVGVSHMWRTRLLPIRFVFVTCDELVCFLWCLCSSDS